VSAAVPSRRALLERAFRSAVAAADPVTALADHWPAPPAGRLVVLALGKAAAAMAAAAEAHYGARGTPVEGIALVPRGHGAATERIEVREAGHPVPDAAGVAGAEALLSAAERACEGDLALVLVSGGGSALATAPDGPPLAALVALTRALLASGADIHEINTVRRRLDRVKGGRLAAAAFPARTVALAVSDVVGDDPLDIASGPTVADPAGPERAVAVLDRYEIAAPAVRAALEAERRGRRTGPPRPDDPRLARTETHVVASGRRALEAAERVLVDAGGSACLRTPHLTGDARDAGRAQAREARELLRAGRRTDGTPCRLPALLLSGGETTVTVRGKGRGGRNSTFALALALALPDGAPVHALAADSDGLDGVGGHAGAFVAPDLFARLPREEARALDAEDDSYAAFHRAGSLLVTGPTRTNVNDVRLVWVDPPGRGAP
jgi:hydroxypyruvate reductase